MKKRFVYWLCKHGYYELARKIDPLQVMSYKLTKVFKTLQKLTFSNNATKQDGFKADVTIIDEVESKKAGVCAEIKKGDIVRVEDIHHDAPHFYEVNRIQGDGVISQPACFKHTFNEITAIYRYNGEDFKCIWQKEKGGGNMEKYLNKKLDTQQRVL